MFAWIAHVRYIKILTWLRGSRLTFLLASSSLRDSRADIFTCLFTYALSLLSESLEQAIFLYLVWFSLCSSLFWELRDNGVVKNLQFLSLKPRSHVRILLNRAWSRPTFLCLCFSKYSLKEIIDVEENHDVMQGDRYLIDVVSEYWKVYFRKPLYNYLVSCGLLVLTLRYSCFSKELNMEGKSKYRQSPVYNILLFY